MANTVGINVDDSQVTPTVVPYTASGAIAAASSIDTLGSTGALAMTLIAPPKDGIRKLILAVTAHAHTVTVPANKIQDTNATDDTVTFAHVGDAVLLESIGGVWQVLALRGATLSEV